MAFEVTCGGCSGQLLVETAGVVVECPLCGAHLSIPADPLAAAAPESSIVVSAAVTPDVPPAVAVPLASATPPEVAIEAPVAPKVDEVPESFAIESSLTEVAASPVAAPTPLFEEQGAEPRAMETAGIAMIAPEDADLEVAAEDNASNESPLPAGPLTEEIPIDPAEQQLAEEPTQVMSRAAAEELQQAITATPDTNPSIPVETTLPTTLHVAPIAAAVTTATTAAPPSAPPAAATDVEMVPRQKFILVARYASVVTLVLLYFIYNALFARPPFLESLPDLVPELRKDGAVGMPRVLPKFNVAPGHELRLGQSERYGNLRVTPVKVTRGPVNFVHIYGNAGAKQAPTQPVLKLWLELENVSSNQEFPPLDNALVFRRIFDPKLEREFSLNFLCPADQRVPDDGERYFVYDLPEFSEFALEGQSLGRWLAPGEKWLTYIPSQEGIADAEGEWVWRVLFRKGLNAKSGRGVTTLIDVQFRDDEVIAEG